MKTKPASREERIAATIDAYNTWAAALDRIDLTTGQRETVCGHLARLKERLEKYHQDVQGLEI